MFHFNFQFTKSYFWIWKICFHIASTLTLVAHKQFLIHLCHKTPFILPTPLIIFHWIFQPLLFIKTPPVYSGPKSISQAFCIPKLGYLLRRSTIVHCTSEHMLLLMQYSSWKSYLDSINMFHVPCYLFLESCNIS